MKTKSADTGKFVSRKAAKDNPKTTYVSDDYPARMLRKLVRMVDSRAVAFMGTVEDEVNGFKLIATIKLRMGWK